MRLRLVVRRHNLPDTAVVWAIDAGDNPTISQLLEQVNEVIPLESGGDWGLEDYSVEIKGSGTNFECLHFQAVGAILHEDDEVLIRPLLSQDLKLRKVSGRHQITSDGKHLYDGSVFGRPKPRGPVDRPAIEIPPRKRRRITYDEGTDISFDESLLAIEGEAQVVNDRNGNRQLVIMADFEDDDEEDDEDFEPEEEEDDDDEEEDMDEKVPEGDRNGEAIDGNDDSGDEDLMGDVADERLRLSVRKLREAFPEAPISVCKYVLVGCDGDLGEAWEALARGFKPSKPQKAVKHPLKDQETLPLRKTQSVSRASSKGKKRLIDDDREEEIMDEDSEASRDGNENPLLDYYDQHELPGGSISSGKPLSKNAKIIASTTTGKSDSSTGPNSGRWISESTTRSNRSVRFAGDITAVKSPNELELGRDDESDDEDFDVEVSSIDSSGSSSNSSSDTPSVSSDDSKIEDDDGPTSSSGSDNSSTSGSDSDSEPDEVSSKPREAPLAGEHAAPGPNAINEDKSCSHDPKPNHRPTVPPGQGKKSTKLRNQRRRKANAFERFNKKGILPAGTTLREFNQLNLGSIKTPEDVMEALATIRREISQEIKMTTEKATPKAARFEAKRQELLASLASGGVEVGPGPSSGSSMPAVSDPDRLDVGMSETGQTPTATETERPSRTIADTFTGSIKTGAETTDTAAFTSDMAIVTAETPAVRTGSASGDSTPRLRKKLDLGAASRLLFGALGVRTPKTKADQEKVRDDLTKHVKPLKTASNTEVPTEELNPVNGGEDPEAWRETITLRAVECCYEGIELSPAPFPFVQRWDPQQKGVHLPRGNRGGRGKKTLRNQSQYYDNEHQISRKRKRKRHDTYDSSSNHYFPAGAGEDEEGNYQNVEMDKEAGNDFGAKHMYSDGIENAVNDQIMNDVEETTTCQDVDDLPPLPADISTLSGLIADEVRTGMVIAFKQLILSEATNWEPQMSGYRTAVVIKVSNNGELELTLAKRDRDQTEKYYDEETGERIYGKFDMPGDDDQDDMEDDGFLSVTFTELVEPKVVQGAPQNLTTSKGSEETSQAKANTSIEESTTLDHETYAETPKVSTEVFPDADRNAPSPQKPLVDKHDSPSIRGGELSADEEEEILSMSISESAHEEISEIIRDAGFRSTVPSSVLRAQLQLPTTPIGVLGNESYSPKFNGLGSSPYPEAISSPSYFKDITPVPAEESPQLMAPNDKAAENSFDVSSVHYPKLSVPSPLVSDLGRQPDYPMPGDDTLHQFDDDDPFFGDHEDLPAMEEPDLPQVQSANVGNKSIPIQRTPSPFSDVESPSSGNLPSPNEIFSTARSSTAPKQEPTVWKSHIEFMKKKDTITERHDKAMEELDATLDAADDPEQRTPEASQNRSRNPVTVPATSQNGNRSEFRIPAGSQQVDLTLSSDVEPEVEKSNLDDDSYNDDFGLPRGPGWVQKKIRKSKRQSSVNYRASSQAVSQTGESQGRSVRRNSRRFRRAS